MSHPFAHPLASPRRLVASPQCSVSLLSPRTPSNNVRDFNGSSATIEVVEGAKDETSEGPTSSAVSSRLALPERASAHDTQPANNVRHLGEASASRTVSDALLIAALERGERGAAQKFYERVERAIFFTVSKVLGQSDHEFEDVVQLSLERVVLSISRQQYGGRCNLTTWAGVIASRVAIDHLRRRRHERRIFWFRKDEEDASVDVPTLDSSRPDHQFDIESRLKVLRQSLGKISPDKAETVVLFEVMGHDLPQIARLTGVSEAAAQSRLVRGRKELAQLMRRKLGESDD